MPDLGWVRNCFGASEYYDELFDELLYALAETDAASVGVEPVELDLRDRDVLAAFLTERRVNVATMSYVLYELAPVQRAAVLDTVVWALHAPAVLLVAEPEGELGRPGCVVTLYRRGRRPLRICHVSDGHFRGTVTPLDDFAEFHERYPIVLGDAPCRAG